MLVFSLSGGVLDNLDNERVVQTCSNSIYFIVKMIPLELGTTRYYFLFFYIFFPHQALGYYVLRVLIIDCQLFRIYVDSNHFLSCFDESITRRITHHSLVGFWLAFTFSSINSVNMISNYDFFGGVFLPFFSLHVRASRHGS